MRVFTAFILTCVFILPAKAAELFVVEQDDCPYCVKFHREISPAYPNTSEGKQAPIRLLQLGDAFPAPYSHLTPVTVTPTFILVHDGEEIDRMIGYSGDEFFWYLLGEMLAKVSKD